MRAEVASDPKPMKTDACRQGSHWFCPGWFREDITRKQPPSGLCCCDCHDKE